MTRAVIKPYADLSLDEFHDLIALRESVFIIEQDCPYQEVDGWDKVGEHLIVKEGDTLIATLRILPPDSYVKPCSIGRVVVHKTRRGTGLGEVIMRKALEHVRKNHRFGSLVSISAQEHLKNFYEKIGFEQFGEGYLEDNIPHIPMRLDLSNE